MQPVSQSAGRRRASISAGVKATLNGFPLAACSDALQVRGHLSRIGLTGERERERKKTDVSF